MIDRGDGVLPDQFLCRDLRAEITCAGAHVAVCQLEPRPGERVGELIRVRHKTTRDLFVGRVEPEGKVGGEHRGSDASGRVVGMRHSFGAGPILWCPLMRTSRALGQFPFVTEQVPEEVVAPLGGRGGPGDFQTAGDRVRTHAGIETVFPAQALFFKSCRFRVGPAIRVWRGTVGLAEGMAPGDERHGLLVVHRHAGKGLADVACRSDRIRVAVRAFRVDVN